MGIRSRVPTGMARVNGVSYRSTDRRTQRCSKRRLALRSRAPGHETRLREDLEAVADAQQQPAPCRVLADRAHHRAEAGQRTRPQVVAVGEATRQDDQVGAPQVGRLVPDGERLGAHQRRRVQRVPVAVGAREDHHADPHAAVPTAVVAAQRLHRERLDERVGEQLRGQPLHDDPGCGVVRGVHVQLHPPADPHTVDLGHAQVGQARLDRPALGIEDALAGHHGDGVAERRSSVGGSRGGRDVCRWPGSRRSDRRSAARTPRRSGSVCRRSTSAGSSGPGGVRSQSWRSSQSRTNCLSNDACGPAGLPVVGSPETAGVGCHQLVDDEQPRLRGLIPAPSAGAMPSSILVSASRMPRRSAWAAPAR